MTYRLSIVRVLALALVVSVLPALPPASASPGVETFVSMFSEYGDYVGHGEDAFFFPGNAAITIEGDARRVAVSVDGGNLGRDYRFTFEAPDGERLREGEYLNTGAANGQAPTRAELDISGSGRGCNSYGGRFRVKRIVEGAGGEVTSLWVVYEQHCDGSHFALFGEIRYAVPGDGGLATVGPLEIRWPDTEARSSSARVVPVTVVNPSDVPVALGSSSVEGPAAADFRVRVDDCENVTLDPGESCTVRVRWVPTDAGTRTATLVVPESTSFSHSIALEGFAYGGSTRFVVSGDPGDPLVGPNYHDFGPATSRFIVRGSHQSVRAQVITPTGEWLLEIDAPAGDVLAPGATYEDDDPYDSFDARGARLTITTDHTVCSGVGHFTVSEIAVDDTGRLERFGMRFELHCGAAFPGEYGILDFHAEQPNTPPPRFPSYRRTVSFSLGDGVVSGRVTGKGPRICFARVEVGIVVIKGDRLRMVAVARTDRSGRYRRRVEPLKGSYLAFVPLQQLGDGSLCRDDVSPVRSTG